jgi:hypothetical protein
MSLGPPDGHTPSLRCRLFDDAQCRMGRIVENPPDFAGIREA